MGMGLKTGLETLESGLYLTGSRTPLVRLDGLQFTGWTLISQRPSLSISVKPSTITTITNKTEQNTTGHDSPPRIHFSRGLVPPLVVSQNVCRQHSTAQPTMPLHLISIVGATPDHIVHI
ncbi:hypothetical protein H9L39_10774 [Fusarium oxysporum f. sp. albedinis]|nr:hypothetical protein H9L39_10774 [Fusarium oxysporum f. sp. albedinis]